MDKLISQQATLSALRTCYDTCHIDYTNGGEYIDYEMAVDLIEALPSAQPERTKRIIGKSRYGMTMWYQCESCNEPVDEKDLFCSGCGRKFEDGLLNKQTGGNR